MEDELKRESGRIWLIFKPYMVKRPLTDKEWTELQKVANTEKYTLPEGCENPKVMTDPSYWKSAIEFYKANYTLLLMRTIEHYQKGLK